MSKPRRQTRYHSPRRQRQAEETRAQILAAARRLFGEQGYGATSLAQIASEAGVAVQTIYASVGSKRALVFALVEVVDEDAGVPELRRTLASATEAEEVIDATVRLTRRFQERCGDVLWMLVTASPIEEDVAGALEEGKRRHRMGMRRVAAKLSRLGALRSDVPERHAADVLGLLTSFETYDQLRNEYDWSFDECEDWIKSVIRALLLEPR